MSQRNRATWIWERRMRAPALLLVGAIAIAACGEQTEPPTADSDIANMYADQIMFGVEHYITANGVQRGLLRSDTAFMYEDSALVRVRPVNLTLYDEQGEVAGEITARSGVLDTRSQRMTATGDVLVESAVRGQRIETEELHFDPNRDRVWSEVATTLHRDGTTLHGSGFTSNTRLTDTRLTQPRGRVEGLDIDL